jgi:hypothetical protein
VKRRSKSEKEGKEEEKGPGCRDTPHERFRGPEALFQPRPADASSLACSRGGCRRPSIQPDRQGLCRAMAASKADMAHLAPKSCMPRPSVRPFGRRSAVDRRAEQRCSCHQINGFLGVSPPFSEHRSSISPFLASQISSSVRRQGVSSDRRRRNKTFLPQLGATMHRSKISCFTSVAVRMHSCPSLA